MVGLLSVLALVFWAIEAVSGLEYVVHPRDRKDQAACARTTAFLDEYLGGKNVKAYISEIRGVTQLWLVQLDASQVRDIRREAGVSISVHRPLVGLRIQYWVGTSVESVRLKSTLLQVLSVLKNVRVTKNDGAPAERPARNDDLNLTKSQASFLTNDYHQQGASPDLAMVSWPPGQVVPEQGPTGSYSWNQNQWFRKTYVYIIDNGISGDVRSGHVHKPATTNISIGLSRSGDRMALDSWRIPDRE